MCVNELSCFHQRQDVHNTLLIVCFSLLEKKTRNNTNFNEEMSIIWENVFQQEFLDHGFPCEHALMGTQLSPYRDTEDF